MLGCRSAAAVILDLEEPAPKPVASADLTNESATSAGEAVPAGLFPADTITERPPVESVAADSVLALLPQHASGQIDWGAALDSGTIAPRSATPGQRPPELFSLFGYDFYFGEVETAFPHSTHTAWLSCESCHPAPYRRREGTKTTMAMMQSGESCGLCHGGVAFKADACERCHPALELPAGRISPTLETDLVIPRDTTGAMGSEDFPPSIFPHWSHRIHYRCSACHPAPFAMHTGETTITMTGMQRGETCGACHDGARAFGVMECGVCHRPPPPPITLPEPDDSG